MFAELLRRSLDAKQERERNEADFRDLVRMVLHEVEELKKGKNVARQDVENFAQSIQEVCKNRRFRHGTASLTRRV